MTALLALCLSTAVSALAQGTAFTCQGRLSDGGSPANGSYDLTFSLCDAGANGTLVAGAVTNAATAVRNGLFLVTLDFGASFSGAPRWLEIGVQTNGGGAYTALIPRQQFTAMP